MLNVKRFVFNCCETCQCNNCVEKRKIRQEMIENEDIANKELQEKQRREIELFYDKCSLCKGFFKKTISFEINQEDEDEPLEVNVCERCARHVLDGCAQVGISRGDDDYTRLFQRNWLNDN